MKSLLKSITLLLVSGVIILLFQQSGNVKAKYAIYFTKVLSPATAKTGSVYHFSFTNDVLAKLLPEIKYFQIPL